MMLVDTVLAVATWLGVLAFGGPSGLATDPTTGSETVAVTDTVDDPTHHPMLLMHYMPWYATEDVRGFWGGHWTGWQKEHDPSKIDADGLPDIWSHFHPLIGPYDSTDRDAVECHLLQMKLAGVDGVIVDWYGTSHAADYPANQEGSIVLADMAHELGMRFAVCYEDRTLEVLVQKQALSEAGVVDQIARDIAWLRAHWFSRANYVQWNNRPLLLNFGPIYVKDARVWDAALGSVSPRPALFPLHHLWRDIDADGGFAWVHPDVWAGDPTPGEIARRLDGVIRATSSDPSRVIPSALPGFKDVYEQSYPGVAHRGGRALEETLDAALRSGSPIVQLVTWNDYGEGTMIEPTHEFGYLFLEIVQDRVRAGMGSSFGFTHDDLRLPARLYALRKSGDHQPGELDDIARALAEGRTDAARRLLNTLGG